MPRETFLDKAIGNYKVATIIKEQMGSNKIYLDHVAFYLQQSVEMCLKYQMENNGIEHQRIHDIDQLIQAGRQGGVDIIMVDYIMEHSKMISSWETRAGNLSDDYLEAKDIEVAMAGVSDFLDRVVENKRLREARSSPTHKDEIEENER